ncbi:MAG: PLP-dependent aminotransferase family protein [Caldiserica bacterium]|nr:PLP-dependent aminotransferase family protein [Caldisericota bacterium]MDH7562546.1 PLP-dependent aminotransferase family protein [Caldisericota bacterium]
MTIWLNDIKIEKNPGAPPAYEQLAEKMAFIIRSGNIPPGERLPSVRSVSAKLAINRGTVLAAYRRLQEMGLVQMRVGQGTMVREELESGGKGEMTSLSLKAPEGLRTVQSQTWFSRITEIPFSLATPEENLIPEEEISRTIKRVLKKAGRALFAYGPTGGEEGFREAYAAFLKNKGIEVNGNWVLPTSGATQGFDLIAKALFPGDLIFFEEPLYSGTLKPFTLWPFQVETLPVEDDGVNLDHLRKSLAQGKIPRLVVLTPDFQNPTGSVLSLKKREEMVFLSRKHDFLILEDAVFSELAFEPVPPPLISLAPERVIRIDSFSKTLAPGLRLGTIVAHPKILEFLTPLKQASDFQTPLLSQAVMRELILSGFFEKHLETIRSAYRKKRDLLHEALQARSHLFNYAKPKGGFFFWVELQNRMDASELLLLSSSQGVSFAPGTMFSSRPQHRSFIRLSVSRIPPEKIKKGVEILSQACESLSSQSSIPFPQI